MNILFLYGLLCIHPNCSISGYPIKVVYNETQGIVGNLNMPYKIGPSCVWSPVGYLIDYTSKCTKSLTKDVCTKNSMLDYQMYLLPLPSGMKVGNIPKVLANPGSKTTVPITTTYYAALEPELYVNSQIKAKNAKEQDFPSDDLEEILEGIKKEDENVEPIFKGIANEKCAKLEQFSSKDHYQEDQVHVNDDLTCINAVLEVRYDIFWSGSDIDKIHVTILLGNITMLEEIQNRASQSQSQFQHLGQIFSVHFKHSG